MNDFIKMLDEWFGQKAPKLPVKAKEVLVKIAPYLAIIAAVLLIPAILALLTLGSFGTGFMMRYGSGYGGGFWGIAPIFTVVILVLYVIAIPGLFARNSKGWNMLFYASLVSALENLLRVDLVGLILGLLISFYFLFQLKPYYFGGAKISSQPSQPTPPQNPQNPSQSY